MYVVECADGSWYTGYTTDVERRLEEHNGSDAGAKYTRVRRPVRLVAYASFDTRKEAMKAEYHFKLFSRKKKEDLVRAAEGSDERFADLIKGCF